MRISKLLRETWILFSIGMTDLVLTLILFCAYGSDPFIEASSVARQLLAKSPFLFAGAKIFGLILCLAVIEFFRQKGLAKEQVVKRYLRIGIIAYLFLYVVLVLKVNLF